MRFAELTAPLKEDRFRPLLFAHITSVVGDNFTNVALAFAVLELGGSAADVGIVLAAKAVPLVLFVLVGGVWADRVSRRSLMVAMDLVRFVSQGLLAVLLVFGRPEIWHVVVLTAILGTANAFYRPAFDGIVPQTVPTSMLQRANALLSMCRNAGTVAGPAASGILIELTSPGWAIGIDAVTYAASAALLAGMRGLGLVDTSTSGFLADLSSGWREVRSRVWLWGSILEFGLFQLVVLSAIFVLGPVVAEETLGGAGTWGLILTISGVGSIAGGALTLRLHFERPLVAMYLSLFFVVPALLSLGAMAPAWVTAVAFFSFGITLGTADVLWETTVQEQIPLHTLSRVSAYDWMGSTALRPLGQAVAGPIAIALGIGTTFYGAAALVTVATLGILAVPAVRAVERPAEGALEIDPA